MVAERGEPQILSVTEVTQRVKSCLETHPDLGGVGVRGELANFKHHGSGHMYFTLKDAQSSLRCVMFRGQNRKLQFRPEDGMEVITLGSVGVYPPAGQYQLYVEAMEPAGMGSLYLAFEELKKKLQAEGLFDETRKQPLPFLPQRVGVITSASGAAVRDIFSVARRRFPNASLVLAPVLVQGKQAPGQMIRALRALARVPGVEVVILGRGGGAWEELWAFNDEALAREVAASPVPVVSAVGHETDYTIADFVADVRAPTPSAAAELVLPSREELVQRLERLQTRSHRAVARLLQQRRQQLDRLKERRPLADPWFGLNQRRERADLAAERLIQALTVLLRDRRRGLETAAGRLSSLSPLAVLERGFSLVIDEEGRILRRAGDVDVGERLWVRPTRGQLQVRVEEVQEKGEVPSDGTEL